MDASAVTEVARLLEERVSFGVYHLSEPCTTDTSTASHSRAAAGERGVFQFSSEEQLLEQ